MSDNPLEGLVNLLDGAADLAKEIGTPVNEVCSGLQKAEDDINGVENFIRDLNDVAIVSNTIGDLCYALTEIPVVGEILDALGTVLRKFGSMVAETMEPINTFKKEVLDEVKSVINKINKVLSKITGFLNFFINKYDVCCIFC